MSSRPKRQNERVNYLSVCRLFDHVGHCFIVNLCPNCSPKNSPIRTKYKSFCHFPVSYFHLGHHCINKRCNNVHVSTNICSFWGNHGTHWFKSTNTVIESAVIGVLDILSPSLTSILGQICSFRRFWPLFCSNTLWFFCFHTVCCSLVSRWKLSNLLCYNCDVIHLFYQ